jgi:RHS repeat-associated protein
MANSHNTAETSLQYCGEQYDATLGMYNLRARYYNPANGRFNARDSFMGHNQDPQSLHRYAFAQTDPVNGVDPSGHELLTLLVVISVISILAVSVSGCSKRPTPTVRRIYPVRSPSEVPGFASHLTWPHVEGEVQAGDLGPHSNASTGSYRNCHWVVIEGTDLQGVTVHRWVNKTIRASTESDDSGKGFQGPGQKPSEGAKLDEGSEQMQLYVPFAGAWVLADAPGADGVPPEGYPFSWKGNFLIQVKQGNAVLAEAWYDVIIEATASGATSNSMLWNGSTTNK